jgi:hypothetical protein
MKFFVPANAIKNGNLIRKKSILPLLFLVSLSCNKQDKLTWTERHVLGSWYYDEVKFTENWSIGSDNLTKDYEDITLTFYDDFTITSVNTQTGETFTGMWEINVVEVYSGSDGSSTMGEELIAAMSSNSTGEVLQLIWEGLSVNKRRIRSYHNDKEGYYDFRLQKY